MYESYQAPPPPPKSGAGKVIAIVAGVLVALLCCCVVGVVLAWNSDFAKNFREGFSEEFTNVQPEEAKAGDCLTRTVKEDASDAKVVDCSSPEAVNRVIGVITGITEAEFDRDNQTLCEEDYPEWESVLWFGARGGVGRVLCVAPNG